MKSILDYYNTEEICISRDTAEKIKKSLKSTGDKKQFSIADEENMQIMIKYENEKGM